MEKEAQLAMIISKRDEILAVHPININTLNRLIEDLIGLISGLEKMSLGEDGSITQESASCNNTWRDMTQIKRKELRNVGWWIEQPSGSKRNMEGLDKAIEDFHWTLNSDLGLIGVPR